MARATIMIFALGVISGCSGILSGEGNGRGDNPANIVPEDILGAGTQKSLQCSLEPRRIWRLTPDQLRATLATVVEDPADLGSAFVARAEEFAHSFSNNAERLDMSEPQVELLVQETGPVAEQILAKQGATLGCGSKGQVKEECIEGAIDELATNLFRRPLLPNEKANYSDYFRAAAREFDEEIATWQLVRSLLLSPQFLFRHEGGAHYEEMGEVVVGKDTVQLHQRERAEALSYLFLDGPPDAELVGAAESGALEDKAEIETQVRRLLANSSTGRGLLKFLEELFHVAGIEDESKDPKVFPRFNGEIADSMHKETLEFFKYWLFQDDAQLETLYTANYSFVDRRLADLYGVAHSGDRNSFVKTSFPAGQRAGVLTHGGIMAQFAWSDDTNPVLRGRFVQEVLLCNELPPTPPGIAVIPPPPDGERTNRERLSQHSEDATCSGCHRLMDPIGLTFESFDGMGVYRQRELGQPVDTRGELVGTSDADGVVSGAPELLSRLSGSDQAQQCFIEHVYRYMHGREVREGDECFIEQAKRRFAETKGDMRELLVAIATSDSFLFREANTSPTTEAKGE